MASSTSVIGPLTAPETSTSASASAASPTRRTASAGSTDTSIAATTSRARWRLSTTAAAGWARSKASTTTRTSVIRSVIAVTAGPTRVVNSPNGPVTASRASRSWPSTVAAWLRAVSTASHTWPIVLRTASPPSPEMAAPTVSPRVGHRRQQAVEVDVVDRRRDRVERAGDLVGHGAQRQAVDHRQHPLFEGEQPTADLADRRVVDRIAEALHQTAHDGADVVGTELPVLEPVAQAAQLGDEAVEDRGEAHLGDLRHGAHRRGDGPEPAEVEAPERGHGAGEQSVARGDQVRLGPAGGLEVELERRPVDVRGDAGLDRASTWWPPWSARSASG